MLTLCKQVKSGRNVGLTLRNCIFVDIHAYIVTDPWRCQIQSLLSYTKYPTRKLLHLPMG